MGQLTIVGGGPGSVHCLTGESIAAIRQSRRLFAPPRLAQSLKELSDCIKAATLEEMLIALEADTSDAVVVVSGDTGFYSFTKTLLSRLDSRYHITVLPGISSLQTFCARLGKPWENLEIISAHGANPGVVGPVTYCPRTFFLTGGKGSANQVLAQLCTAGLGDLQAHVGENLAAPDEKVQSGSVAALSQGDIGALAVLMVENPTPTNRFTRLRDRAFIRGKVPMTKEAVRIISTARLEIQPTDVVYDIGAGTGSVSVAMARLAWKGCVYAVENKPEALSLLEQNRSHLGSWNIAPVQGTAPEALAGLPPPQRVFIGGSSGQLQSILELLLQKNAAFTLCITAVTLETMHSSMALLESMGFLDVEMDWVQISHVQKAGNSHLMQGENPIAIITGRWQP